ncbi:MAG TPA: DEAD/DEAH box helicase [Bacillales bacterium]|nr:DEAD/DEAH box helicase [Bacillales bacterium]
MEKEYDSLSTFLELELSRPVSKAIDQMGFEETTPIQAQTIPLAMQGKDLIGQAQTGTGKTAAFGIPTIESVDPKRPEIQALVVTPTRELAMQVAAELNTIGQFKKVTALPVYGGQDIGRQIRALKNKPSIIVGTPGRLLDHIRRRTIRLGDLKIAVLDEADEMLNMGFIEDIEKILENVPDERQTMLFSATMPNPIRKLAERFMKEPQVIRVQAKEMTVSNIDQQYIEVQERDKFETLCRLLDLHSPDLAIVFGRTKRRVDELSDALNKRGYSAEGLHGDLSQAKRDRVMSKFKSGRIEVLIATDVAARGLDISGVTHVYNFDIPQDPESYVHRIGRTGRAGKTGIAVTLVTPKEFNQLKTIERLTKKKMVRQPQPSFSEVLEGRQNAAIEKIMWATGQQDMNKYKNAAETLLERTDSVTLLAAALKLLTKEPDTTPVTLTAESPLRSKKSYNRQGGNNRRNYHSKGSFNSKGRKPHRSKKPYRNNK